MTEKQFRQGVNQGINHKYRDNWGIISGTFSPFEIQGMHSAMRNEGFLVWVKDRKPGIKTYGEEKEFKKLKENYVQDIIDFINEFEIKMKEYE